MDLKCIMMNEKSQSQQVTYCMTAFVYLINSWNEKNYKNEEQINGYQG